MAIYAIGDVQGCLDPLQRLLDTLPGSPEDRLWFVGDLVNRGPRSLDTLRFIKGLGSRAVTVLGNHDLHLLMVAEGYGKPHKEDTIEPILSAPDRDELLDWLRTRPLFHREGSCALVHAGLLPQWDADRAAALAGEVEAALRGGDYREFLAHMWGSEPDAWDEGLQGWDRLRVIVNVMTRLRFCTPDGRMEFRIKGPPERAPAGFMPWFRVPGRASAEATVVFGHWSALGFLKEDKLLGLDSGCLWGGALTAVRLGDRKVFQLECERAVAPTGWQ